MDIGKAVSIMRKAAGLKQNELAGLVGCSPSHISFVEHGHTSPSINLIEKVAKATGYKIDIIITKRERK